MSPCCAVNNRRRIVTPDGCDRRERGGPIPTEVRRAIVYALAFVGDAKTTVPVLEKVLAKEHEERVQAFVRAAIQRIGHVPGEGEDDPFAQSASWLFWEDREDPARGG
jgi:hypothetical protein